MADASLSATGLDPTAIPAPPPSSPPQPQPAPPPTPRDHDSTPFQHPPPYHLSLNPAQPTTILLLHGLLSSHLEYAYITPLLPEYHLLLVDLPGHSRSFSPTTPPLPQHYRIPTLADAVAPLIRAHAHNSRAHIVGLSMGGFVALDLARRYPELCASVWVTGAAPLDGWKGWVAGRPRLVGMGMAAVAALPETVYEWLVRWQGMRGHAELRGEMRPRLDTMARAIVVDIAAPNVGRVVRARIAVGYGLTLGWRAAVPVGADVVVEANARSVIPYAGARPTHDGEDGCWQGEDSESSRNNRELHGYQVYRVRVYV
ncbi:Alpha/Beta hydrolase protein [Chaetomium tenue]|uniref:Alpha/Beta hydrolase protein n=1 Tax=Chaetomium tenue TaxID=1854479 RepID=A0ACB7P879_9PEZI|nr:Alpha/Beta hydrolase protein [Chaetomium globosum]